MFQKKKLCRENQNTYVYFMFSNFFSKIVPFLETEEKYCRAGEAAGDNMAHAHCMLVAKGYNYTHARTHTHTQGLCNTHCFSTATMVLRTRLSVTLYVHCLSC